MLLVLLRRGGDHGEPLHFGLELNDALAKHHHLVPVRLGPGGRAARGADHGEQRGVPLPLRGGCGSGGGDLRREARRRGRQVAGLSPKSCPHRRCELAEPGQERDSFREHFFEAFLMQIARRKVRRPPCGLDLDLRRDGHIQRGK